MAKKTAPPQLTHPRKHPPSRKPNTANSDQPVVSLWTKLSIRLSEKEKVLFVKYFAVLLDANLSLSQSVEVLREQATGATKKILETASSSISGGHGLADGLAYYPHVFSPIFINLIRAGERSGTLSANLQYLATQSQKQYDLKQSIRGAMLYPLIVFFGGLGVSIFIIVFIFPNIIALFETMHIELPATTRLLLLVANFFGKYPIPVFGGALAYTIFMIASYRIRATRHVWDYVLLRVPIIGSILKNSILANFFRLLGTLLQSGMSLTDALEISNATITNYAYNKLLRSVAESVNQGRDFAEELSKKRFMIPSLAQRLIHVGNATGMLEKMLLFLADFYTKEVDEASKRIATLVEPMLIVAMGVLIGFIALSVISPIYQVVANI